MKKIIFTLFMLSAAVVANAQKFLPEIKKGTVLSCSAFVSGQEFPLLLTINSLSSPLSIGWSVEGYGDGTFEMTDKAVESATKMAIVNQPAPGTTKLADDETFSLISKDAYKNSLSTKTLVYNGINFKMKSTEASPMKINGKEADVTHFTSDDGKLALWILNQPAFPLIVQTAGMPTDIVIHDIK